MPVQAGILYGVFSVIEAGRDSYSGRFRELVSDAFKASIGSKMFWNTVVIFFFARSE